MLGNSLNHRCVSQDYDVFAGLDVDKTSIAATFTNHQQNVKSLRFPYKTDHLIHYVQKHFPGEKVVFAYEAGPTGFGLYDQLTAAGYRCLVVPSSMIPTAPGDRIKTNRLDSEKLATGLRGGILRSIHIPSMPYRYLRHLIQIRDTYVRQMVAFKCRIKALLLLEGIPFPEAPPTSQWSQRVMAQLSTLTCPDPVRFKLDQLSKSLLIAKEQTLQTQREIRRFCRNDAELSRSISYLTSIPGIGWIVAGHLLARIGDWRQLSNVRQMAAFLGLVPSEHSTGDQIHRGTITRSGDARLRNKLVQTAWVAIRQDPQLLLFYQKIYQRHPKHQAARKAIVAVARKLTTRIYTVLKEQRLYVRGASFFDTRGVTYHLRERLDRPQNIGEVAPSPREVR